MDEELIKYILKIFIVVIILFGIILVMNFLILKIKINSPHKTIKRSCNY